MNNTFLEFVAKDLISKAGNNLSRTAVIFPNKRASLFMNEYLARLSSQPIWSPTYMTISELFTNHSALTLGDPIKLVCDLQKSFVRCTGNDVSLDQFYGWGQLLISDFDDIDKNMADADKIFANVQNLHEYDSITYLSDEQKKILQAYFSIFSDDHQSQLKQRFITLWSHLGDIYHDFNTTLQQQKLAYEGALYRNVVTDQTISFEYDTYVFIGFNLLQEVEKCLFKRLKQEGKAKFYWDFDHYYMKNNCHEAGHYIRKYLEDFPNELDSDDECIYHRFDQNKKISFISGKTENIQARYIAEWLNDEQRIDAGRRTAIVLCDESLLQTVIHAIPPQVSKINVTTGFPLAQSPVASFVKTLISLQTSKHNKNTQQYKIDVVKRILRHPYTKYISPQHTLLLTQLLQEKIYYPNREQLAIDEGMELLFNDINNDENHLQTTRWITQVLQYIGRQAKDTADAFFQESVFRMYTIFNRITSLIQQGDLCVNATTYERIITQIINSTSIPFHGEPVEGIQIMGVLETRNLDFDHMLILSCNEGNMPKGINDSSFIPYSIRDAYGLTTIQNKIAIYSYYFHRMIQRASDITFTYNNATESTQMREMSRFMLQMMINPKNSIKKCAMKSGQQPINNRINEIAKDDTIKQILDEIQKLSPSAINSYLRCPLIFYYRYILGISEPEPEDENDTRVFGNIFHQTAYLIYKDLSQHNGVVHKKSIQHFIHKDQAPLLERYVDQAFNEVLFKSKNKQYKPQYNGLQIINRKVILTYIKQLLRLDEQLAPFTIKQLEKGFYTNISFTTPSRQDKTIMIGGIIDRLDQITNQEGNLTIRVVDYKTGRDKNEKINNIDEIFDPLNITKKHSDYYFQTFLYATIIKDNTEANPNKLPVSPALLFIQNTSDKAYDPTLLIDKQKIKDIAEIEVAFKDQLKQLLAEIFDIDIPFKPTCDTDRCKYCCYGQFCGRR